MKIVYEAKFSLKLRSVLEEVRKFEDSINDSMAAFGFTEKMYSSVDYFSIKLKPGRLLSYDEQEKIKEVFKEEVVQKFPKYEIVLTSFGLI